MSSLASSSELPQPQVQELVGLLDEALAECARTRSAADVERIAAMVMLPFDDPSVPEEHAALLPALLERRGDAQAARLLAGIAVLARPQLRRLATGASERLGARGVAARAVRRIGELEVQEASLLAGGPVEILLVVLGRPGQRRVQTALVGIADRALVKAELGAPDRHTELSAELAGELPDGQLRPIGERELLERLREATANAAAQGCPVGLQTPFCLAVLGRALAGEPDVFAHLEVTTDHPLDVDPEEGPENYESLLDTLVHDFGEHVREHHGTNAAIWRHGEFASCALLEWKGQYMDGRLGHWTVADVHEFLLDYAPRKLTMEPEAVDVLPACIAEVLRFLNAAGALAGDPLAELVGACERLAPQFERANADRSNWGLAKAMATQMLSEGVDLGDEAAVGAWIEEFNGRPRAARDQVIAGARPELRLLVGGQPPARSAAGTASRPGPTRKARRRASRKARKGNRRRR